MQSLLAITQRTILVVIGVALVAATAAGLASPPTDPHLELTCETDFCVVEASYVLPVRRDNHEVTFRWETHPAQGYPDNSADDVHRTLPSGIGRPEADGSGYRYTVADVVWHSDIRCDEAVTVTMTRATSPVAAGNADKPIPPSPDNAFCSAYGIEG